MNEYAAGGTFLNTETGTFQGTTEGNNIHAFRDDKATNTVLGGFPSVDNCQYQSIMCCFGRDRQPNDNNGNCADPIDQNCLDADPMDNSNLCHVDTDHISTFSDPFLFPNESEGAIHCHGLAWADDSNDLTAQMKYNNFFYVTLYDHMYSRGYVETTVDSDDIAMCGCIEEMPPVSRSDCTQIDATQTFVVTFDGSSFVATPNGALEVEFASCEGINPITGENKHNDLASYVYRLNQEGEISDTVKNKVFDVLVGYTNVNDYDNEASCVAAYEKEYGTYPDTTKIEDKKCHTNGYLFRTEDNNPISLEECQELCYNTDRCEYFAFGLDSNPIHRGVCMGCEASMLQSENGFNSWQMTDIQSFPTNEALGKPAIQTTTLSTGAASQAVDGNTNSISHTSSTTDPSWSLDLEGMYSILSVNIFNRIDCCQDRLAGFQMIIWNGDSEVFTFTHSEGTPDYRTSIDVQGIAGDKVEILIPGDNKILSLAEVEVFGEYLGTAAPTPSPPTNYALGKPAIQTSTVSGEVASQAVDGNTNSISHTTSTTDPSWSVDLESTIGITSINIYNRVDCCQDRLSGFKLIIWRGHDEVFTFIQSGEVKDYRETVSVPEIAGDKVEILLPGDNKILSLAEVEVFGEFLGSAAPTPSPPTNYALGKPAIQTTTLNRAVASRAVDGNTNSISHTSKITDPSWSVDLESTIGITSINIYNRVDCCQDRLSGFKLIIWRGHDEVFTFTQSGGIPSLLTTVSVPEIAGDKVEIMLPGASRILSLAEVEVFGEFLGSAAPTPSPPTNYALGKPAIQTTTLSGAVASRAVDGNINSITHTTVTNNPSWSVDLQSSVVINTINIYNRVDCCQDRLSGFRVIIWNGTQQVWTYSHSGGVPPHLIEINLPSISGDKVEIMLPGSGRILTLAEVQVLGS